MSNDEFPFSLSELQKDLDGTTTEEVIQARRAQLRMVAAAARRGNALARMTMELEAIAHTNGLDVTDEERLEDDDFE